MPRKNRREPVAERRSGGVGGRRWSETGRRGDWTVQLIRGNEKAYVCPGCNQRIEPHSGHVVAWLEDGIWGVDNREHWHQSCWERGRSRR